MNRFKMTYLVEVEAPTSLNDKKAGQLYLDMKNKLADTLREMSADHPELNFCLSGERMEYPVIRKRCIKCQSFNVMKNETMSGTILYVCIDCNFKEVIK